MQNKVNIALQILPSSKTIHPYQIVDKAIEVIAASGLRYKVTPFETVMEGSYDEIMNVVKLAQEACYKAGADSLMTYVKIQTSMKDVSIDDKMEKYE
ncbi:MAG: thiamine-binding protein [Paludibacter sp.]